MALRDTLSDIHGLMTAVYADEATAKFPLEATPALARISRDLEAESVALLIRATDYLDNEQPEMVQATLRVIGHVEELAVNTAKLYQRTKDADKTDEIRDILNDIFGSFTKGDSAGEDDEEKETEYNADLFSEPAPTNARD